MFTPETCPLDRVSEGACWSRGDMVSIYDMVCFVMQRLTVTICPPVVTWLFDICPGNKGSQDLNFGTTADNVTILDNTNCV